MKRKWLIGLLILAVLSAGLAAGCKKKPAPAPETLTVSPAEAEIAVGETQQLTAAGGDGTYAFASSAPAVATVSDGGLVTAVAVGSADITVSSGEQTATCKVTVTLSRVVPTVDLDLTEKTLHKGDTYALQPLLKVNGETKDVAFAYESTDTAVVTVSDGRVTAVNYGEAKILVSYEYQGHSDTLEVPFSVIEDVLFAVDKQKVSLVVAKAASSTNKTEDTVTVTQLKVDGEEADRTAVTWASADTDIATVGESTGAVAAVKAGTTSLTATFVTERGTEAHLTVDVEVTRETVDVSGRAVADKNWDFGADETAPYMHVVFDALTGEIPGADVTEIADSNGKVLSEGEGYTLPKAALALGMHEIRLGTDTFVYAFDMQVTDSAYLITDFKDQFGSRPSDNPNEYTTHELVEFQNKTAMKFTTAAKNTGSIWTCHGGYLKVMNDNFNLGRKGGYLVFDLWAENGATPGGYLMGYVGNTTVIDPTFTVGTDGKYSHPAVKVVDENFEETTFVYNAWNTVVIDFDYFTVEYDAISFLPSFGASVAGKAVSNYYADFLYLTAEKYEVLSTGNYGYAVTFDTRVTGSTVATQHVGYLDRATDPGAPENTGMTFDGWYLNGEKYDFSAPVTGAAALVARYEVTLDKATADLYKHANLTLNATGLGTLSWSSSAPAVASVDQNGKVTGAGVGDAVITVRDGEGHSASCTVTVTVNPQPTLVLDDTQLELYADPYTVRPQLIKDEQDVAADAEFTYTVKTGSDVVSVNGNVITAIGKGTATVEVAWSYGDYSGKETVAVSVKEEVSLALDRETLELVLEAANGSSSVVSATVRATATVNGGADGNPDLTFAVTGETVIGATQDGAAFTVTSKTLGSGSVEITYTAKFGTTAKKTVTVSVSRDVIAAGDVVADKNWDYGREGGQEDYMPLARPAALDIPESSVLSFCLADGTEVARDGFTLTKADYDLGRRTGAYILTEKFKYVFDLVVTDSYFAFADYSGQFATNASGNVSHTTDVAAEAGKEGLIKFYGTAAANGVWYNRGGTIGLDKYGMEMKGGYLIFDLKAEGENTVPAFYLWGLSNSGANIAVTVPASGPSDAKYCWVLGGGAYAHGEWNTMVVAFEAIDKAAYTGNLSFVPGFSSAAGNADAAYYANFRYLSAEKYEMMQNGRYGYSVSFDTQTAEVTAPRTQYVFYGEKATDPGDPTVGIDGAPAFLGWTLNGKDFDFAGTAVTGNIVLAAKYEGTGVYDVEHYVRTPGGFVLSQTTEGLSADYGANVTGQPVSIAGYTYDETLSASTASGTVPFSGRLKLKLFYNNDSLTFHGASELTAVSFGGPAVFSYESAAMTGAYADSARPNTWLYKGTDAGSGWNKRLSVPAVQTGKYLVLNVFSVTAESNGQMIVWADGSKTAMATLYDETGERLIASGANVVGRWVSYVYYVDPESHTEGNAYNFSIAHSAKQECYISDYCFITEQEYAKYFDVLPEGVTEYAASVLSVGPDSQTTYSYTAEAVTGEFESNARPGTMKYTSEGSGMGGRRLKLDGAALSVKGNYLVLDIMYTKGLNSGTNLNSAIYKSDAATTVGFTFYNESGETVAGAARALGTWYRIAVQVSEYSSGTAVLIGLNDWGPNAEAYISKVSVMTPEAFAVVFPTAAA